MRVPLRFSVPPVAHRWVAAAVIAVASAGAVLALRAAPESARVSIPLDQTDWVMYDSVYRLRPIEDRSGGAVVCIAVDQESLDEMGRQHKKKAAPTATQPAPEARPTPTTGEAEPEGEEYGWP